MITRSRAHLEDVRESYWEHQFFAFRFALGCFQAGLMAMIHGLVPACFETSASDKVKSLAESCTKRDTD